MIKYTFWVWGLVLTGFSVSGQNSDTPTLSISFQSGLSMGRWIYDKGMSEPRGGYHQGYDRTHLAVYVPLGLQLTYNWKGWSLGTAASISWLSDDELIASNSKPLVPREYFITDGSSIAFRNLSLVLERTLLDYPRYKLRAAIYLGTFRSQQDHPRERFFGRHYLLDLGLDNQIYVGRDWFILVRPAFKRKHISTVDSIFPGESHEIITFGIDYGFGVNIF
jgi:hypothetical protein